MAVVRRWHGLRRQHLLDVLTSLVWLLVVRVAWAERGKPGWKRKLVPQCPPDSRAFRAGLWLVPETATPYPVRSAGRQRLPGGPAHAQVAVAGAPTGCEAAYASFRGCELFISGVPRGLTRLEQLCGAVCAFRGLRAARGQEGAEASARWPTSPTLPSLAPFSSMLEQVAAFVGPSRSSGGTVGGVCHG